MSTNNMPNYKTDKKQSVSNCYWESPSFVKVTRTWYFIAVFGPLVLLYAHMFCVKNGCILPLSIPSQSAVYINKVSITVLFVVLTRNFWLEVARDLLVPLPLSYGNEYQTLNAFSELIFFSAVLSAVYVARPNVLMAIQENHAAILSTFIVFTVLVNSVMSLAFLAIEGRILGGFFSIFFHGAILKPSCFMDFCSVVWGLLDLVFMLNAIGTSSVNNSAIFIFSTQYFFISVTLLFRNSFKGPQNRVAFMRQERIGYICMAKFFILMPFLGSLPLLHVTTSQVATHPSPAHLCCYLAMFAVGFVIYATVNYRIDMFLHDLSPERELAHVSIRSIPCETTIKRLMASDYWYCVYRPDYLGMLLMWISWLLACGANSSTMAMLVLGLVILAASAHQSATTTFNNLCQKRGLEEMQIEEYSAPRIQETLYTLESTGLTYSYFQ